MKRILALVIFLTTFYDASAQLTDSLQTQLSRKWANSKTYSLKLAASMPEKDFDFKPTPEQMSFSEQLLHIAYNN